MAEVTRPPAKEDPVIRRVFPALLLVLAVLLAFPAILRAGGDDAVKIDEDAVLKEVRTSLPANWSLVAEKDGALVLRRNEPVWVLMENRINAPPGHESDEELAERIRKAGRETPCEIVFRTEKKWSEEKLRQAQADDERLREAIAKLPEKHKITHLRNPGLSRKGEDVYVGKGPEEAQRISAWALEKSDLEAKRILLPDCASEKYSLFLVSRSGAEDEFHLVAPRAGSEELAAVERRMGEVCGRK